MTHIRENCTSQNKSSAHYCSVYSGWPVHVPGMWQWDCWGPPAVVWRLWWQLSHLLSDPSPPRRSQRRLEMPQVPGSGELQTLSFSPRELNPGREAHNWEQEYNHLPDIHKYSTTPSVFFILYFFYRNVENLRSLLALSRPAGATPSKLLETWLIPSSQIISTCQFMWVCIPC